MLNDLIRDGKLVAEAITATDPAAALAALPDAAGEQAAALALATLPLAGTPAGAAAIPALIAKLAEDGVAGIAAAWVLGQLDSEDAVRAVLPEGRLDTRQNGYHALAVLAARGKASATLAAFLVERVQAEIQRAKGGGTGLAEHACRPLAILGHPQLAELVQQVIENDRFCDRYELDRQRSAVASHGKDRDSIRELVAPWTAVFADNLWAPPAPKPEKAPEKAPAKGPAAGRAPNRPPLAPPPRPAPRAPEPPPAPAPAPVEPPAGEPVGQDLGDDAGLDDDGLDHGGLDDGPLDESGAPAAPPGIDWKAFAESEEFTALPPQAQGLVTQLGPLLEQLSAQAIRAYLSDLSGQEFAALLLQVLPQALQPQHVQMALHPHALNGYQAMAKWLARTGVATQGDELLLGVKLVRKQLRDQMRKSGMLGGPDYADPDEAAAQQ